jgi:hypothetical protein
MPQTIRLSPPSCTPTLTSSRSSARQRPTATATGKPRKRVLSSTGLLVQDRSASQLGECALLLIEAHPLVSREAS